MLNEFLFTKIEEENIGNIQFQQDGVISRRADVIWPPLWRFEAGTVNYDCYRAMLNDFWFTKIEEEDIGNIWFPQDGAKCYTAEATLDVLRPALSAAELTAFGHLGVAI